MAYAYDTIRCKGHVYTFIKTGSVETPRMVGAECFTSAVSVSAEGPRDFHISYPVITTKYENALTGDTAGEEISWSDLPAIVKRRFNKWSSMQP